MRSLILSGLFIITFVFFIANGCFLEENQKPDPYTWDFGSVKEGTLLKHVFILRNESKNTLVINKLQTSCGCAVSTASHNEIPQGQASKVEVTFNTKGYSGGVKQFVYVHTNDPKKPIIKLTVSAEIVKKRR